MRKSEANMTDYQLIKVGVLRRLDGANIPADALNKDWREYLVWLAQGNVPDPADPDPLPDPPETRIQSDKLLAAICIYFGNLAGKTPAQVLAGIKAVYQAL